MKLESETKIELTFQDIMSIAHWIEGYRDPDKQPQFVTIKHTHTGIGPAIEAYIELKEGEGVWKNFTNYDSW